MPKLTLKEKEENKEKELRYKKGYKDFWWLLLITFGVWLFETPAVVGLILSVTINNSQEHFYGYGVAMAVVSVIGFLLTVIFLAFDKRAASIIASVITSAFILLICALVYTGYNSALNTSGFMVIQIITSYIIPITIPVVNIIMVNRRI